MADYIYNRFKYNLLKKLIDMDTDTITCALMDTGHSANHADVDLNTWSQVSSNEISGTGYTSPGRDFTSTTVSQDDTDDEGVFDAEDAQWTSASFSAYYALLYDNSLGTDDLICSFDFGGVKTVTSGTFTIEWATEGIINLN